jgi:hypothetical protein
MTTIGRFLSGRCIGIYLWAALAFCCSLAQGAEPVTGGERALLAKYPAIKAHLDKNVFGAPIYLESTEREGTLRVDMYGIFNHPFDAVSEALRDPGRWCDITSLHINIKACTWKKTGQDALLTLYSGRKHYQPPSEAYPLKLQFRAVSRQPQFLEVALEAEEGPLGTKDHRIRLQAAPLESGSTLVYFSYTYGQGAMARMAIKSYFSTLGRGKVGFSTVSRKGSKPVYIEGVRGAVERNTVRYYLALQTFLETLKAPEEQRFEQRISRWYDLTARYPRQLKELNKGDYLSNKRKERANQVALQQKGG